MAQSSPRSSSGKAPARPRTKAGASQAGAPKGSSSRAPGAPEPAQPGFLARFFAVVARAGVGAARAWKATDPQVKRDAAAFVAVAASIVIALREWFQISGEAGDAIHAASAGLVGIFSVVLPLLLIALAGELVSARSGRSALPHHVAGGIGITMALTGLVHISRGNPGMGDDPGLDAAGGLLGWFIARPLALLLSGWGAGALLVLLLAYSILLATRTAVADVPARLRDLAARLSGERAHGDAPEAQADPDPAKEARRKGRKDLAAGDDAFLDEYDGDESFRQAADTQAVGQTRLLQSGPVPVAAPDPSPAPRPRPATPDAPTEMLTQMRPAVAPAPVQVPAHVP
ncbi:MAG: DNA translocase FtsK, partial [Actinomyces sp.]|nr:DNA translocase FtsK [Actinomyces sp.]